MENPKFDKIRTEIKILFLVIHVLCAINLNSQQLPFDALRGKVKYVSIKNTTNISKDRLYYNAKNCFTNKALILDQKDLGWLAYYDKFKLFNKTGQLAIEGEMIFRLDLYLYNDSLKIEISDIYMIKEGVMVCTVEDFVKGNKCGYSKKQTDEFIKQTDTKLKSVISLLTACLIQ